MREYRLDEIYLLQMGKTPSRDESSYWQDGENAWVCIADLTKAGKYISKTKEKLTDKAVEESGIKIVPPNTVIMSFKLSIGKTAITLQPIYTNEAIMAFIDKKVEKIIPKYSYYLFSAQEWEEGTNRAVMGATLNKATLSKYKVRIHDYATQERIVEELDKITEVISKRKEQLEEIDNLVKSQFIEMFGGLDLRNRQDNWTRIGELAEVVGGNTPKTGIEEYWNGEFCWVTPAEIDSDTGIIRSTVRRITQTGVDSCSLKRLPKDTVLLSSRAPIGKVAIAGVEMYCNQGFKNLICGEKVNTWYVYHLLKYNTEYLNSLGRGATFKEISKSIVENIYIPVPSLGKQNEFARFVEQTDKSKFRIKESLKNLENCYKALLQKYFG